MIILNTITGVLGAFGRFCRRPVGCNPPLGAIDLNEHCRNWIRDNPNTSKFAKTSWGTYIGLFNVALGAILGLAGKLKEKPYLKWLGWGLACLGAGVAAIGKLYGFEFDITNGVVAGGTAKPQTTPEEAGIDIKRCEKVNILIGEKKEKKLDGWFITAPRGKTNKTIIYLHGVRNNAGDCLANINRFQQRVNANVLISDPRGFGYSSDDKISSDTLIEDAEAMYDYLVKEKGVNPNDISIFGHSLGSAVATELATKKDIDSLILQSPFTSTKAVFKEVTNGGLKSVLPEYAAELVSDLAGRTRTRIDFDSLESIKEVKAKKILICHGIDDPVFSSEHSDKLIQNVPESCRKEIIKLKGARHGNYELCYDRDGVYRILKEYIEGPTNTDNNNVTEIHREEKVA